MKILLSEMNLIMYYIIVQDQDGQNISIKTNEELRQIKCGCGDQQVDGHKY